jgi:FIMAH domain
VVEITTRRGVMKGNAMGIHRLVKAVLSAGALLSVAAVGAPRAQAQVESVLHSFTGQNSADLAKSDGAEPLAGLIMDSSGNLFGTTSTGGSSTSCAPYSGCGTAFELTADSSYSTVVVLHSFAGSDGVQPYAGLSMDSSDDLFGTTFGGFSFDGNAFELSPPAAAGGGWTDAVLHSFSPSDSAGVIPRAAVIMDSPGDLFGTTENGGSFFGGAVFELVNNSGSYSEKVLYSFRNNGPNDGSTPIAGLIMDSSGNLFGTTYEGGSSSNCPAVSCGTVYELADSSGIYAEKVLYNFGSSGSSDGANPGAGLIMDSSGDLFGTTVGGGSTNCPTVGCGTVFELSKPTTAGGSWTETVLHTFTGQNGADLANSDGASPGAGLIMGPSGHLFGTTEGGGSSPNCSGGCGTVFELSKPATAGGSWTETVLHTFTGQDSTDLAKSDGEAPSAGLTLDPSGSLLGTTEAGGSSPNCSGGCGTVFAVATTPLGAIQLIIARVNALLSQGVLNQGQANSLLRKLNNALRMINGGKINGAIGNLKGFIGEAAGLYNSGVLTEDEYTGLIGAANQVIEQIQTM